MVVLYYPIVYILFKMLESKIADGESSFFEPCIPLILILIDAFVKRRLQEVFFYAI